MPWLYRWVNRAYRDAGHGTTSNARRQRRLAQGVSSQRPAYRDLEKGEGEWEWVEEEEGGDGGGWGWDDGWGWDWEEGWQSQSQGLNWKEEEDFPPLQKGRQPPLPPRPTRETGGLATSSRDAGFAKSPSLDSSSSQAGPVAKGGRHGPRATSSPPVPAGTKIVGGEKKKKEKKEKKEKKGSLCKKEIEPEEEVAEEDQVEEEEAALTKAEEKEELKEEKIFLCKKVAIDWHGVLSDSDNRVSEDSLCAVEKLLAKGHDVTIVSYGGHDRNKATLLALKELRIFPEISYQFVSRKTGQFGKCAWLKHLGIGCIIDDDVKINLECFEKSIQVYPILGHSGEHSALIEKSGGKVKQSANLRDAIDLFLSGH